MEIALPTHYVDIITRVREDRQADFYRHLATWHDNEAARLNPVVVNDNVYATYWSKLSPHARNLLCLFALHPGQEYEAEWLAENLRIPSGASGVAGAWAWPGRHAKELGIEYPWSWRNDGIQTWYWLEPAEAEKLRPMAETWMTSTVWLALELENVL